MVVLFVYGTLQHRPLLQRLLGREPEPVAARLAGHRAAPLSGRAYPGLVVDGGSTAPGRLIEVTEDEAAVLDHFEGPEYERTTLNVMTEDGTEVRCGVWLLTGSSRRLTRAGAWSLERFLAHDVDPFLGGSAAGDPHPGAGP